MNEKVDELLKNGRKEELQEFLDENIDILYKRNIYKLLIKIIQCDGDIEFIKKHLSKLSKEEILYIILKADVEDYIKEIMLDNKIYLKTIDKLECLLKSGKTNLMKEILMNSELDLTREYKDIILLAIIQMDSDIEFIKRYIDEKNIELGEEELTLLLLKNEEAAEFARAYSEAHKINIDILKEIRLPKEITIGIEIEGDTNQSKQNGLFFGILPGWKVDEEIAIGNNGQETKSPILTANRESVQQIYYTCYLLSKLGQSANYDCGGHVHIGSKYLDDSKGTSYKVLVNLWDKIENVMYIICNEEGEILRPVVHRYARSAKNTDIFKNINSVQLENNQDLKAWIIDKLPDDMLDDSDTRKDRFFSINFSNLPSNKIKTVEFRGANGTFKPKTWIENINLFGSIIELSREIADIYAYLMDKDFTNNPNNIGKIEEMKNKIKKYEELLKLPEETMEDREIILGKFLELAFRDKEQRQIYKGRYTVNSKFVKNNNPIEQER